MKLHSTERMEISRQFPLVWAWCQHTGVLTWVGITNYNEHTSNYKSINFVTLIQVDFDLRIQGPKTPGKKHSFLKSPLLS